jgi:hypothetical protein
VARGAEGGVGGAEQAGDGAPVISTSRTPQAASKVEEAEFFSDICATAIYRPAVHGDVSARGWVRNIEHAGVSPHGLAEDIAGLLAAHRALKLTDQAPA